MTDQYSPFFRFDDRYVGGVLIVSEGTSVQPHTVSRGVFHRVTNTFVLFKVHID